MGCWNLPKITIPASVTSIGFLAFSGCSSLAAIVVAEANSRYSSRNGVLLNKDGTTLIQCSAGKTGFFTVPSKVDRIGDYAFAGCAGLTGLYFKGDLPSLGMDVFSGAGQFTAYSLPGAHGWGTTLGERPVVLWDPQVQSGATFGLTDNKFGFVIRNEGSPVVVVEACTNLASAVWVSVGTNVLSGGTSSFSDPEWNKYASRCYRFRMP